jgi:hypothetical protein
MGMKNDMRLLSLLLNNSFILPNTEMKDKQLTKCKYLKSLTLPPEGSQIDLFRLTHTLHNFYKFLERHTWYLILYGWEGLTPTYAVSEMPEQCPGTQTSSDTPPWLTVLCKNRDWRRQHTFIILF